MASLNAAEQLRPFFFLLGLASPAGAVGRRFITAHFLLTGHTLCCTFISFCDFPRSLTCITLKNAESSDFENRECRTLPLMGDQFHPSYALEQRRRRAAAGLTSHRPYQGHTGF
jgi:hypothetical protein